MVLKSPYQALASYWLYIIKQLKPACCQGKLCCQAKRTGLFPCKEFLVLRAISYNFVAELLSLGFACTDYFSPRIKYLLFVSLASSCSLLHGIVPSFIKRFFSLFRVLILSFMSMWMFLFQIFFEKYPGQNDITTTVRTFSATTGTKELMHKS